MINLNAITSKIQKHYSKAVREQPENVSFPLYTMAGPTTSALCSQTALVFAGVQHLWTQIMCTLRTPGFGDIVTIHAL